MQTTTPFEKNIRTDVGVISLRSPTKVGGISVCRSCFLSRVNRLRTQTHRFGMSDLFVINRADIFAVYPRIFNAILITDERVHTRDGSLSRDTILLPTNSDYQDRVYTRLLTIQKAVNDSINSGVYVIFSINMNVFIVMMNLILLAMFFFLDALAERPLNRCLVQQLRNTGIQTFSIWCHRYQHRRPPHHLIEKNA